MTQTLCQGFSKSAAKQCSAADGCKFGQRLALADQLLRGGLEPNEEAEVYYRTAKSLFYLEDLDGALFLLKRALKMHPDVAVYRGFEGQILFELGRFKDAMASLSMARGLEPESAQPPGRRSRGLTPGRKKQIGAELQDPLDVRLVVGPDARQLEDRRRLGHEVADADDLLQRPEGL